MKTATQKTAMPTRKLLSAALVAPMVTEVWGRAMADILPSLAGPEASQWIGAAAAIAVGYFVPDAPNGNPA